MTKRDTKTKILRETNSLNPHPEEVQAPLFQGNVFFDPRDLLQVKYEMLRWVSIEGGSKTEASKLFGVSRPTFYEAESAFALSGLAGLIPRQRGPKAPHKLNTNVMTFIEEHLKEDRTLRAEEIAKLVFAHFGVRVHSRSIERAISRKKKRRRM